MTRNRAHLLPLALAAVLTVAACGSDTTADAPGTPATVPASGPAGPAPTPTVAPGDGDVVAVHEQFEYYDPCRNQPVSVDGTDYYPVIRRAGKDLGETGSRPPVGDSPEGAARVAPPGPGDDVGTMVVYADGSARFESDSGLVTEFTATPLTYDWVC